jgi:hypothetical protein
MYLPFPVRSRPGLVKRCVDEYYHAGAIEVAGPVSTPFLRARALCLVSNCGWTLTVEDFASESKALLPRLFARYTKPPAEAADFTVPEWAYPLCPLCGQLHRECLFASPPSPLLKTFVAKAREDEARAILVAPFSVAAPNWSNLLRASVIMHGHRQLHPNLPSTYLARF